MMQDWNADTKSRKRREMIAQLSFDTACEVGFRGSLDEREWLMVLLPGGEPNGQKLHSAISVL
jgi:hypothetical protein